MTDKRLNIGFFTCHLDNEYAFEVIKGVEYAARELDVNLIIFPGMYMNASYNDPKNAKYDYQYNSIFYYASHKTLDALIVSIGSIGSFLSESDMISFLKNFNIPILTIEIEVPGYPYLYTEGKTGLRHSIEHLINYHGVSKIGFVSGRKENADATERLNTYFEVLTANNIPIDTDKIVYGNFSEFTEDIVNELLDKNPDLEAVVFANDQMAIGGYNAIKARGLEIGKDILVTGFDNSTTSLVLEPPLTTCDNNIMDLGYESMYQVINLLKTGKTEKSILSSEFICRQSCGCDISSNDKIISALRKIISTGTPDDALIFIKNYFMKEYLNCFYSDMLFKIFDNFFMRFINVLFKAPDPELSAYSLNRQLDFMINNEVMNYFTFEKFTYSLNIISRLLINTAENKDIKLQISNLFNEVISHFNFCLSNRYFNLNREHKANIWSSMYITKDTLTSSDDEVKCFNLIMEKLQDSGFKSAYLYLYDIPVSLMPDGSWKIPDNLLLQACNNDKVTTVFQGADRIIPSSMVFHNNYTPNNRRCTFVVTPVFTNDIQHGLFVCESDIQTFSNVYSTTLQLGTSLKFISLMKQQLAIQNRLELSMTEINEKNDLLNRLYITDELTKLYNRRGFFELVQKIVNYKTNSGKQAMILFADMDNLKQVNDKFGHKSGDFALKQIADILTKSFEKDAIIARFGGDEFVAFSLCSDLINSETVSTSIDNLSKKLNDTCDKPFYIDVSYGIACFECHETLNIEDILMNADESLYIRKRYKRKSVLK